MVPLYSEQWSPSRSTAERSRLLEQVCQGEICSRGFEFTAKRKNFSWLTLNDMDNGLDMAAPQPSGAWIEKPSVEDEVRATKLKLLACERVGLLHSVDYKDRTKFIFASRFHQR